MKIVAFVPIKLNSERLPKKMLLSLGNKLLFQHLFDTLTEVKKVIDIDVYCFCSDDSIKNMLPKDVFFLKRNCSLDKNETKGIDIYKSFVSQINADLYVLAHATSPFVNKNSIIAGIGSILNNKYDSAFSVSKIKTFCWHNGKPLNYSLTDVVRTQDLEPIYYETSAFYIFTKNILMEHDRRIGFNPFMVITDRIESIDIDDCDDYELAQKIAR
jgi:CMP-N-acetylneuraminic acid synthetase